MRNFPRESLLSACAVFTDGYSLKAIMTDFSRMGATIKTESPLLKKRYVTLLYRNEKNDFIQMLCYVVHSQKQSRCYSNGLQFIGIESRNKLLT